VLVLVTPLGGTVQREAGGRPLSGHL